MSGRPGNGTRKRCVSADRLKSASMRWTAWEIQARWLEPSETDDADAIASAYLYAAKGDSRAAAKPSRMQSSQLRSYAVAWNRPSRWFRMASPVGNS